MNRKRIHFLPCCLYVIYENAMIVSLVNKNFMTSMYFPNGQIPKKDTNEKGTKKPELFDQNLEPNSV